MAINLQTRGVVLSLGGAMLLTPDALLLRLAEGVGAAEGTFLRSGFLALGWSLIIAATRGNPIRALMRVSLIGLVAAVALAADILTFVLAVQHTNVANTLVIMATIPAFAGVLGFVVLREQVDRRSAGCIVASFLGVLIIFWGDLGSGSTLGNLFAVLTAFLYALYLVLLRRSGREEVVETLCLAGIIAAICVLPFSDLSSVPLPSVAILAAQSGVLLPIGFALYFSGIRYLPATKVALLGLLEPVVGPLWAWAVLGEAPTQQALVGGAIVLAAVVVSAGLSLSDRAGGSFRTEAPAV